MENLLEVNNLQTTFQTVRGKVTAVDGVSFQIRKGEILGVVGESGCGKSVTSQSIMRLYDEKEVVKYKGEVLFEGQNLLNMTDQEMRKIRGNQIAMIFQDALSSLDPVFTIGNQIVETLKNHNRISDKEAWVKAVDILTLTGIPAPAERVHSYPHELSGGMRQRAMIAMALSCSPKLLIADEPTTALDVTIQAQIMDLIVDLNRTLNMGIMLITHDLGVVAQTCFRVIIMYLGQVIEEGSVIDIFERPLHPYTKGLIQSMPKLDTNKNAPLHMIKGTVPSLTDVQSGCRFYERCPISENKCSREIQELKNYNETQKIRCWKVT